MPLPRETLMASTEYRPASLPPYTSAQPPEAGAESDYEDERADEVPSLAHEIQEVPATRSAAPLNGTPLTLRAPAATHRLVGAYGEGGFNPLGQWGASSTVNATARGIGASGRTPTVISREPGRAPSMRSALVPEPAGNSDTRKSESSRSIRFHVRGIFGWRWSFLNNG
jgi:hypothetical protein